MLQQFICVLFCCVCFFRLPKVQELINLIQEAKVDEVESWLQTNMKAKQKVFIFLSKICLNGILCVSVDIPQSPKQKHNTH